MTQILVHETFEGIAIATDSRAVVYSDEHDDESRHLTVRKLFHPVPNVYLVAGGAGYGLWLCERLDRHIAEQGLADVAEAIEATLPFLQPLAEAVKTTAYPSLDRPHLDRFYVIVAGTSADATGSSRVAFRVFASDHASDPVHVADVEKTVTIPRQVMFEYRLSRLSQEESSLEAVEKLFEQFMTKAAANDEDIGPPFHFLQIRPTGIRLRTTGGENKE